MAFKIYQGKRPVILFEEPGLPTNDGPIKTALQSRIVIFWKGDSLISTSGIVSGVTTGGIIGAIGTGKVGAQSILTNNQAMSYRFNEYLRSLDQFSIGCWVYFNSLNFGGPFASLTGAFNGSTDQIGVFNAGGGSNTGYPVFIALSNSGYYSIDNGYYATSGAGVPQTWSQNTWHYCLAEVDRINLQMRFWIDNNLIGIASLPSGFILNNGNDIFSLGGYSLSNGGITNMDGRIEEFVILTGNTTSGERNWLWNSGVGNTLG
jgi:hypothetical protein